VQLRAPDPGKGSQQCEPFFFGRFPGALSEHAITNNAGPGAGIVGTLAGWTGSLDPAAISQPGPAHQQSATPEGPLAVRWPRALSVSVPHLSSSCRSVGVAVSVYDFES